MNKMVLVIDEPNACIDCPCHYYEEPKLWCGFDGKDLKFDDIETFRPSWCPLKPLPQKQELTFVNQGQDILAMGWNACIDAIQKGK